MIFSKYFINCSKLGGSRRLWLDILFSICSFVANFSQLTVISRKVFPGRNGSPSILTNYYFYLVNSNFLFINRRRPNKAYAANSTVARRHNIYELLWCNYVAKNQKRPKINQSIDLYGATIIIPRASADGTQKSKLN